MIKIGSLLNGTDRFTETPESGGFSDAIAAGVRTRTVSKVFQCYKSEVRTIIGSLEAYPTELITVGGRNPDGSPADSVSWGADYQFNGVNVSEISPNFSLVSAQYLATDPTAAGGSALGGSTTGCIIGKPWENSERWMETVASGKVRDDRIYLADSFGWNRSRVVDLVLICLKTDTQTVADSFSLAPSTLYTNSGSGPKITWGGSFSMISINGTSISPSLMQMTIKYRRNIAEAIAAPPAGIEIGCTDGVCTIDWKGTRFEDLNSGNTETTGMDVDNPSGYLIRLLCNRIVFDSLDPGVSSGDKILAWTTTATKAQLKFCGVIWREYNV